MDIKEDYKEYNKNKKITEVEMFKNLNQHIDKSLETKNICKND